MTGAIAIFGASSGVGLAAARLLSAHHVVHAVARWSAGGAATGPYVKHACDVRDAAAVTALFRANGADFDAVVFCVGTGAYAPLDDDFPDYWKEIIETNLLGFFHVASGIWRHASACRHLVVIGSLAGERLSRTPGNEVYGASKAGLARAVADLRTRLREAGRMTRVTLITPGFVAGTGFGASYFRSRPEAEHDLFGETKGMAPIDVARAIVWCLDQPEGVEVNEIVIRPEGQLT